MSKQLAVLMMISGLIVSGCLGWRMTGERTMPITKDEALAVATKFSPLRSLEEVQAAPPGPPPTQMWILYGLDDSKRRMAVWVRARDKVEGHVYIDSGISRSDAIAKVKEAGLTPHPPDYPPPLLNPSAPYWSVQIEQDGNFRSVRVDFTTGKISDP